LGVKGGKGGVGQVGGKKKKHEFRGGWGRK